MADCGCRSFGCNPDPCSPPYVCPPPVGLSVTDMTVAVDPDQTGVTPGTRYLVTVTFSDNTVKTSTFIMPPPPTVSAITVTVDNGANNG